MREHWQNVYRYCYSMLLNHHAAEDAAQNVFVKAVKKLPAAEYAAAWLYRAAYTTCVDALRKERRLLRIAAKEQDMGSTAHEDSYNLGLSPEMERAMLALKPRDRALVFARVVEDLEYAELAKIFRTREATLHKRFERARKVLSSELEKGA